MQHEPKPIVRQGLILVVITIAILVTLAALYTIRLIFLSSLIGIGLGVLIVPPGRFLAKKYKVPRGVTSMILLIVGFGAIFTVGYFIVNMISDQIVPVMQKLPELAHKVSDKWNDFAQHNSWIKKSGQSFNPEKYFSTAGNTVLEGIRLGAGAIGGVIFIFFISFYISIKSESYLEGFLTAFPSYLRPKTKSVMLHSGESLRTWFKSQLIAMLIVGAIATVSLKIVGSQYWAFFGAITMVLELIPYIGPTTAFATVALVTLAASPEAFPKTVAAFAVVLLLEGYVVIPWVMKDRNKLPPAQLLILMAILGEWFGVFGFLISTPVLAILQTVYQMTYKQKMDSKWREAA